MKEFWSFVNGVGLFTAGLVAGVGLTTTGLLGFYIYTEKEEAKKKPPYSFRRSTPYWPNTVLTLSSSERLRDICVASFFLR